MPGIDDLLPSILDRIFRDLDLRALMNLRCTSQSQSAMVSSALKSTLIRLVGNFVGGPQALLELLTEMDGYVGGEVAMAYLLQGTDTSFLPKTLELFLPASRSSWMAFTNHLVKIQGAVEQPNPPFHTSTTRPETRVPLVRGVRAGVRYTTSYGTLLVYRSVTKDALVPISQQWGSHRIVYANLTYSGAGYPALLFEHRALLGTIPSERVRRTPAESEAVEQVLDDERRGFDIRLMPTQWSDLGVHGCGAQEYACPAQTRSFVDRGSLRLRVQPLVHRGLKTTVMWRLVPRPCVGGCLGRGDMAWLNQTETMLSS